MKRKRTPEHPSREALIAAAQSGIVPFEGHLSECPTCRELFSMLKRFPKKRLQRLEHADPEAIAEFAAIPIVAEARRGADRLRGSVRFDSWQNVPAAQLRRAATALERRMTLESDGVILELAAERRGQEWEFVGRVYKQGAVSTSFVLKAGRTTIAPDKKGYFYFTAINPPTVLRLLSPSVNIAFDKISWKATE